MAKQIATSTFEHKIDSSHVVRSIQRVTDIARRLESEKFGKWKTAGETLAAARVIKALSQGANSGQPVSDQETTTTAMLVAQGPRPACSDIRIDGIIANSEGDLDRSLSSLENIRQTLSACLAAFDDIAAQVRSTVKEIPVGGNGQAIRRCWEITDCDPEIRNQCRAYQQDDWRCFLADGVACSFADDGDAHAQRRCHECPAFKNNVEALLTEMVHSEP
jgi:hypothetical protein